MHSYSLMKGGFNEFKTTHPISVLQKHEDRPSYTYFSAVFKD